MPLLKRKTVILAKIEGGSYGIDPVPTGAANAILIRNGSLTPQDGESADRALVRPYLGNSPKLPGAIRGVLQFEVELAGAGTAGTAPAWGPLVRGCAYAETLLGTLATGTATAGSVSTITLAGGASAVDQAYKGMRIDITGGAGSGQYATIRDYVGATKVATFCETLAVALTATSVYSIGAQAAYAPVSASFESLTFYFNVDGVLHKMTGARGTVAASLAAKAIPTLKFTFTGLYKDVADGAAPTPVYSAFQQPLTVNSTNTPFVALHSFIPVLASIDVDVANQVVHRALVGSESVLITDRQASGKVVIEATPVSTGGATVANPTFPTRGRLRLIAAIRLLQVFVR